MGYLERLRNEARAVDIVGVVACGLLCLLLLDLMLKFVGIDAFRHDDLRYIGSYAGKLKTEGRWVNWLFFPMLRLADVKLVACANVLCFAVFSWFVFRNFLDRTGAVLATLVCVFSPPVHLLNEWALTSFLSFVLLVLAGFLHGKMRIPLFFLIFGVLFNGALSHFYFLLPLLFLGTLYGSHKLEYPISLVKVLAWWVLGFVIGFACAELVVLVCTGNFIHLADWQRPHYIHTLSDLVDNVRRASTSFLNDLRLFSKASRFSSKVMQLICVAAVLHAGWKWFKGERHVPWAIGLLLLVAASVYVQSIPTGIAVSTRSVACLFLAIIGLIFFSFRDNKPLLIACAILVALPLYRHNVNNIEFLGSIMRAWKADLEKIPVEPQSVNGIVMLSSTSETKQHEKMLGRRLKLRRISTVGLGAPHRWAPVPHELGFRRIEHGRRAKDYLTKLSLEPDKVARFERCGVYEYAVLDNWLLVRFVQ